MRKKIYLAIAYTGYEDLSFDLANKEAAKLINEGHFVFSPISMSHPISKLGGLDGSWDTWKELDMEFIRWCDEVHVINFNDLATKNSVGVNDEIKYAKEIGKEVIYIQKF
jgi:hypothetical protein